MAAKIKAEGSSKLKQSNKSIMITLRLMNSPKRKTKDSKMNDKINQSNNNKKKE